MFIYPSQWADEDRDRVSEYADDLVTGIPAFIRTKLWASAERRTTKRATSTPTRTSSAKTSNTSSISVPRDKHVVMTCNRPYNSRVAYFTEDGVEGPDKAGRWSQPR